MEDLSDHTISMRKALVYCQQLAEGIHNEGDSSLWTVLLPTGKSAYEAARSLPQKRQGSLERFRRESSQSMADVVMTKDFKENDVLEFRKNHLHGNVPCLIRGLDETHHFRSILELWRRKQPQSYCSDTMRPCAINVDWFYQNVGKDTVVPVRKQQSSTSALDDDGRAEECTVVQMTLERYIQEVLPNTCPQYYLKDWHLNSSIQQHGLPYSVPPHFGRDMLNDLLTRFTRGDYKFVYWGPPESCTDLHSDVLNSFSWSLNVIGEKEWTFFVPVPESNGEQSFVIRQGPGEVVFVPSGWKHKVRNIHEALSVNHNWVTAANIDKVWQCIQQEMVAVQTELEAWSNDQDCGIQESMLRGCVGLDVTALFLLILCEQLRLLRQLVQQEEQQAASLWEDLFDMFCLHSVLTALVRDDTNKEPHSGGNEEVEANIEPRKPVCLMERLRCVLESTGFAHQALEMATLAIEQVNTLIETIEANISD